MKQLHFRFFPAICIAISMNLFAIAHAGLQYGGCIKDGVKGVSSLSKPDCIHCSPDGKFVYVKTQSSLNCFQRDSNTGLLTSKRIQMLDKFVRSIDQGIGIMIALLITPDDKTIYVVSKYYSPEHSEDYITGFTRDLNSGKITFRGLNCILTNDYGYNEVPIISSPDSRYIYIIIGTCISRYFRDITVDTLLFLGKDSTSASGQLIISNDGKYLYILSSSYQQSTGERLAVDCWERNVLDGSIRHAGVFQQTLNIPQPGSFQMTISPDDKRILIPIPLNSNRYLLCQFDRNSATGMLSMRDSITVPGIHHTISNDGKTIYFKTDSAFLVYKKNDSSGAYFCKDTLADTLHCSFQKSFMSSDGRFAYFFNNHSSYFELDTCYWYKRDTVTDSLVLRGHLGKLLHSTFVKMTSDGKQIFTEQARENNLSPLSWFPVDSPTGAITSNGSGSYDKPIVSSADYNPPAYFKLNPDGRHGYLPFTKKTPPVGSCIIGLLNSNQITGELSFNSYWSMDNCLDIQTDYIGKTIYFLSNYKAANPVILHVCSHDSADGNLIEHYSSQILGIGDYREGASIISKDGRNYYYNIIIPDQMGWYNTGSICFYDRNQNTGAVDSLRGRIEINRGTRKVLANPDDRYFYATRSDSCSLLKRDSASGALTFIENEPLYPGKANSGKCVFSIDGKQLFVCYELDSLVAWFNRDSISGRLTYGGYLKNGHDGIDGLANPSNISVSPDGKHCYIASTQENAVSWFTINQDSNRLTGASLNAQLDARYKNIRLFAYNKKLYFQIPYPAKFFKATVFDLRGRILTHLEKNNISKGVFYLSLDNSRVGDGFRICDMATEREKKIIRFIVK